MSSPVISVEHLSKAYRIGVKDEIPDTLIGAMKNAVMAPWRNFHRLRRLSNTTATQSSLAAHRTPLVSNLEQAHAASTPKETDTLWALRDVSFEINQGDVVGIIGRNGAGKSTLLKVLSRITEPTSGRAVIHGRVSSLLEVGTGFHPELTGRENVYMNGTILGMRKKEIDRKFDEIVDFSGVEKFLDTPTKRYSSGMQVRLAFAVAAHLEPEILVVDEVLAVGDGEFQRKCIGKMKDVSQSGRTVLFVSHSMSAVQSLCTRALLFAGGRPISDGSVNAVLNDYTNSQALVPKNKHQGNLNSEMLSRVTLVDSDGRPTSVVQISQRFHLMIEFRRPCKHSCLEVGIGIDHELGDRAITLHTPKATPLLPTSEHTVIECIVDAFPLRPGNYSLKLSLNASASVLESIENAMQFTVVDGETFGEGRGFHRGWCVAATRWTAH